MITAPKIALSLAVLLAFSASAADPDLVTPELKFTIRALPSKDGKNIESIEVSETISGGTWQADQPLLEMPHVTSNVPTVAEHIENMEASDEAGALRLVHRDSGEDGSRRRQWFAHRPTAGAIHVRYRAPVVEELAARGAAPPIEIRSEDGAFSGGGATFLLRPPAGAYRLKVQWDHAALPPDAVGVSSLDTASDALLPVATLDSVYFMAGKVGKFPSQPNASEFFSAWQGKPPFDAVELMAWTEKLREHYQQFFKVGRTPYGVFLRRNLVNPGGGMGMYRSFVVTYGEERGSDPTELKFTLAHEMFHTFQPLMAREDGIDDSLSASWFNEGLAVFYQSALPFRYEMVSGEAYLRDLNYHAARYYTNALGSAPNSEVPKRFWEDTRIRTLPYDRGFLYFATVDEAVRKDSSGKRSLDDLMLEMHGRQRNGMTVTQADWEAVLRRELGEPGVAALRDMLEGKAPLPASDAFGPCFQRVSRSMRRYQLGFEPKVLIEPKRIVRGLIAGSAAETAGVRNGDEIMLPVGQDAIQGEQEGVLSLQLRRGDETLTIAYKPRGETVDAWQWQRVAAHPDQACRRPK
jgi:predicted metalloprotease with PDZ domain